MKFFNPQLQLVRERRINEPDAYFLHVVTFCPRTSYRADGVELVGFGPNNETQEEGVFKVKVKIKQDAALLDFEYITPVIHTFSIGSVAFLEGEGWFEVQVVGTQLQKSGTVTRDGDPKTGGVGAVGSATADDKSRPIGDSFE